MGQYEILELRRKARADKSLVDQRLIALHQMAIDSLRDQNKAAQVRERALAQVNKWDQGHLCSLHYIEAWRNILSMPVNLIFPIILGDDAEGIALRQNSPFGFLLHGDVK